MLRRSLRTQIFMSIGVVIAALLCPSASDAAPPVFPAFGSAKTVRGELVSADFIHRTGQFRTMKGELVNFTMPPYAIVTYQGTEADLRDVPLGTEVDFLLLPDDDGQLTRLVGTKCDSKTADKAQRQKFIDFTRARGVAGWIDQTSGKTLTVTFFSANPELFATTWDESFAKGADVTVCVANDELRTWQPTSCGEKGIIVEVQSVPVEGYGCSGRRLVIQVNNMLEGFRQGRIVRVFGAGWKVRNQLYQECLINYGYSAAPAPDFRECLAKNYPEAFPYRTDHSNRDLAWFQLKSGRALPMYSEHLMCGDLLSINNATQSGEFKTEYSGKVVRFTMLDIGARLPAIRYRANNFEGRSARLSDLPIGERYRFHMYQDARGEFTLCSSISDEYSYMAFNSFSYRIRELDPSRGRIDVDWQPAPVQNYQKDIEIPSPYGHSLLRITADTRIWKDDAPLPLTALKVGDYLRANFASEFSDRLGYCTNAWLIDQVSGKGKPKK